MEDSPGWSAWDPQGMMLRPIVHETAAGAPPPPPPPPSLAPSLPPSLPPSRYTGGQPLFGNSIRVGAKVIACARCATGGGPRTPMRNGGVPRTGIAAWEGAQG